MDAAAGLSDWRPGAQGGGGEGNPYGGERGLAPDLRAEWRPEPHIDERVVEARMGDVVKDALGGFRVEGRLSEEEFVDDYAQRPRVEGEGDAAVEQNLRGEVVGRAHAFAAPKPPRQHPAPAAQVHGALRRRAERRGGGARAVEARPMVRGREAKVRQLHVAVARHQHVGRLEVSHDHAVVVERAEALHRLRGVELGEVLVEESERREQLCAVTTGEVLQAEVHVGPRGEAAVELRHEGRPHRAQYEALHLQVGHRRRLDEMALGEGLDGDEVTRGPAPGEVHHAVAPGAQCVHHVQVAEGERRTAAVRRGGVPAASP